VAVVACTRHRHRASASHGSARRVSRRETSRWLWK